MDLGHKVLPILLIMLLAFLQYRLWFEPDGIRDMMRFKKELALQAKENSKLKKRNETLLSQVQLLQKDKDAVESRARRELGMIKQGETFYQVVK
ncbi:MAG: cell division protein FtsB [Gammaproteobacteria bacterium]